MTFTVPWTSRQLRSATRTKIPSFNDQNILKTFAGTLAIFTKQHFVLLLKEMQYFSVK